MGLLGVEIAIDKEPLQVEAQVSNFCQVNRSPGGKRRENILRSAIRALNPRKDSTRPMRLSMDLGGYRSLSNTILASNQDRAVAFRNMGKRTLNPRLNRRGKQFRIPLYGMDSDAACHESSQAYTLGLAMRVPKPAEQERIAFSARYICHWDTFGEGGCRSEGKTFSVPEGKYATLIPYESGNIFPLL